MLRGTLSANRCSRSKDRRDSTNLSSAHSSVVLHSVAFYPSGSHRVLTRGFQSDKGEGTEKAAQEKILLRKLPKFPDFVPHSLVCPKPNEWRISSPELLRSFWLIARSIGPAVQKFCASFLFLSFYPVLQCLYNSSQFDWFLALLTPWISLTTPSDSSQNFWLRWSLHIPPHFMSFPSFSLHVLEGPGPFRLQIKLFIT